MAMYPENARQINQALAAINRVRCRTSLRSAARWTRCWRVHASWTKARWSGILADRAAGPDQYLTLPFLGASARFPTGPFRMAVMLKRPVYFMAGIYLGGNRYQVHFERLEQAPPGTPRDAATPACSASTPPALERHCRAIHTTGSIFSISGSRTAPIMRNFTLARYWPVILPVAWRQCHHAAS